jgi:hypothetical protein
VENNGAQTLLEDFASDLTALPIRGHTTGRNKHHQQFGVESIAIELANEKWIIPCDHDLRPNSEISSWISEAVGYSPDDHMGDRLSASWICREGIRVSPAAGWPMDHFDFDTLQR